jgi:hypothetical protein
MQRLAEAQFAASEQRWAGSAEQIAMAIFMLGADPDIPSVREYQALLDAKVALVNEPGLATARWTKSLAIVTGALARSSVTGSAS